MKIVTLDAGTLPVELIKPDYCESWVYRASTTEHELLSVLDNAEVVITNKVPLRRAVLEKLPSLRFICIAATGYDCVDIDYCRERGIAISNVPGYSTRSVSEGVIASLFALRRNFNEYVRAARTEWSDSDHFCLHKSPLKDVQDATLGIIGRGEIGGAVARLAKGLGMRVLFGERPGQSVTREGYTAFNETLRSCDVLTLHCPLTPETREIINRRTLSQMKPGAMIINTARGPLINEEDLADALISGRIGGAALDVLCKEPPAKNNKLISLPHSNLIITPHIAWASETGVNNLIKGINYNLAGYFGGKVKNSVI
ncbi:D-2-hydroxyacid dehydrogenase [Enterobacteriaceae bacterium RIT697]|uniref:D-2-hydroxyacid dehydrogenase n=1 Tax=Pantoea endophytica TaxID=92488 RepID=UPI0012ADBEFA|nr:D-2-hydroxyacid dehydrogenase [Pantoea endophytica]MRT24965.1 D-2-hydroxyacid dehydrogenase [Enterobacteriaceae bacterium RIT697]